MIQSNNLERRKYPRIDGLSYDVKLELSKKNTSQKTAFELINFSELGLCVKGNVAFEKSDSIEINATYNGKNAFVEAQVMWVSGDTEGNYLQGLSLSSSDIFYLLTK